MRTLWSWVFAALAMLGASALPAVAAITPAEQTQQNEAMERCAKDGAGASTVSWSRVLSDCVSASQQAYALSLKADTESERQELLNNEALADIYTSAAAHKVGDDPTAQVALKRAHTVWTFLSLSGYNDRMKSLAQRSLRCWFQHDHAACASLFPGMQ